MSSKVLIGITKNVRFAIADTTEIGNKALEKYPTEAFMCKTEFELITIASLLSGNVKGDNTKYSIVVKGDKLLGNSKVRNGANGKIMSSSRFNPEQLTEFLDAIKNENIDKFHELYTMGKGVVYFESDYGLKFPYVTEIELEENDSMTNVITDFYERSDQIPTIISTSVLESEDNKDVLFMGGILIQLLPSGDKKVLEKLRKKIDMIHSVPVLLKHNFSLEKIAEILFENVDKRTKAKNIEDYKILEIKDLEYTCDCSREKFQDLLTRISTKDELLNMLKEDGKIEAVCSFCEKPYIFLDYKEFEKSLN
ncbi:Hsp33 family molecular chaperone HslO [Caviibacter abscessus]|uniref:Hsp33 family molecular chaperone HslO n=1 Tax=Caviibacter abscessus TaxID=1766719 RepID=UPI00082C411C|nr:Hsp33 family molecular chaperone HslO [Caviibacter abscessus]